MFVNAGDTHSAWMATSSSHRVSYGIAVNVSEKVPGKTCTHGKIAGSKAKRCDMEGGMWEKVSGGLCAKLSRIGQTVKETAKL